MDSVFSEEDYIKILEKSLPSSENVNDFKIVSKKFQSLRGNVEGYLSEHFSLTITYQPADDDNSHLKEKRYFVKVVLNGEGFLEVFADDLDVFCKESFIYTTLLPELKEINAYKQIAAKCYLTKNNCLVLEDLSSLGFIIGERLKFYNLDQCKMALEALAHYHAYSIIYEERKSKELNKPYRLNEAFPNEFTDRFMTAEDGSPTAKFRDACLKSIKDLIEVIPEDKFSEKKEFIELLMDNFTPGNQTSVKQAKQLEKYRKTCLHGDLWACNIMFKYANNSSSKDVNRKIIDCRLIDFQILTYSVPGFDVELFFYGNTTYEFRNEHKTELQRHYYDSLSSVLTANGIDSSVILTFDDLEEMSILRGPEAKVQAISDMSLLFLPEETQIEAQKKPNFMRSVLIEDRSKYVLDSYKKNSRFRDIITQELIDAYQTFIKKRTFLDTL